MNKPIILDPVGANASQYRKQTCLHYLQNYNISIIRGNASEVMALIREGNTGKGVDNTQNSLDTIREAKQLAAEYKTCVLMSGKIDMIISQEFQNQFERGSALMPKITGTGCLLTAVTAAFHAVEPNAYIAANAAALFYSICGERAELESQSPGSFRAAFIDCLSKPQDASYYAEK